MEMEPFRSEPIVDLRSLGAELRPGGIKVDILDSFPLRVSSWYRRFRMFFYC